MTKDQADVRVAEAAFEAGARVGRLDGPRYRMTYRVCGEGPTLVLVPGIASTYRVYALLLGELSRHFRAVVYDYPGEQPGDGARLAAIGHDDLVDDLLGLLDHLGADRAYPLGISFGSTVTLAALRRDPGRFPRAVLQGGFAHRPFTAAEKVALVLGRRFPGRVGNLPLRDRVVTWSHRGEFPDVLADRWGHYLEQNAATPIAPLVHRLELLGRLDLRPVLAEIPVEVLLIQGETDRIVPRRYFEALRAGLPRAESHLVPAIGHMTHYTYPEAMAAAIRGWCLAPRPDAGAPPGDESSPGRDLR